MIHIAYNATVAQVLKAPKEVLLELHRILSYRVAGSEHMPGLKSGGWDGRSSFLTIKDGNAIFPAGFVDLVMKGMRRIGVEFQLVSKPLPEPLGTERPEVDKFGYIERYDYQAKTSDTLVRVGKMIAMVATGGGKCLGKDTPVLMFDGTIKKVQEIVAGDALMGPDSSPRAVLSTCIGVGPLYRVTPTKGTPYVVNDAHILSLKKTSRGYRGKARTGEKYPKGEIVNINVEEYLSKNKTFHHTHKGWRTGVDFVPAASLSVDPYLLGVILGDGTINGTVSVTTADSVIFSMLEEQAALWGLTCNVVGKEESAASAVYLTSGRTGGKPNSLMQALRELGFVSEGQRAVKKFIPHSYKTASRSDRLALLAGVIDTDGYFDGKCLYLTLKCEQLFDDVLFVARSLGFAAYKKNVKKTCHNNGVVGDYFAMVISGDLDTVPVRLERRKAPQRLQKKDVLVTGLKIEAIGEGDYYGFELNGDCLFMLGDFTVTHNTRIAKIAYRRIGRKTLFLTTRGILMHQMRDAVLEMGEEVAIFGDSEWGIKYTRPDGTEGRKTTKFCVGMVQTLAQRLEVITVDGELQALVQRRTTAIAKAANELRVKLQEKGMLPHLIGLEINKLAAEMRDRFPSPKHDRKVIEEKVAHHELLRQGTIKFLEKFELVIAEEAHELSGDGFYKVMEACKNAHYRLALTATPFMKDDEESNMQLLAACGPIAITVSEELLIDRGILAKPYFKFIKLDSAHTPKKLFRSTPWQFAYTTGIVNNEYRNKLICVEVLRAMRYGLNALMLVQHKAHGTILRDMLRGAGAQVEFIDGGSSQKMRQSCLNRLESGQLDVLIGSTILDVGVDVPSIGMIVLAGGGKAEVSLRQRIGRGLREKKGGRSNVALIVDVYDEHNNHLKGHSAERQAIIKGTPGFGCNVVRDFDYAALGLSRTAI